MAIKYPPGLADRIARVLSEILTDKYGEEYGVKITLHRVDKKTGERRDGHEYQTDVCGVRQAHQ